ncbi:MAG: CobW family GTP-binding protein [Candidatus Methylumidiphilus sp.]
MPPPPQLPVIVLTGFLGSGKTTLLNSLLRQWPDSAVLINEFGATPVDQRLIAEHNIPVTVLAGGCLCCQVRDTLAPTLKNLWMAWHRQQPFARLIIEASGVASPEPVLDVLLRERWLAARLRLHGVITTVAVPNACEQIERFPEALAQVAWADVLALTQADLADAAGLNAVETRLEALAPATPRVHAAFGAIDADALLAAPAGLRRVPPGTETPAHGFHSLSLRLDTPPPWPLLQHLLQTLLAQYGPRLLRIKGVVYLPGDVNPVVLQAAGGQLHPPQALKARAADDGVGRLVFITDGAVEGLAEAVMAGIRGGEARQAGR